MRLFQQKVFTDAFLKPLEAYRKRIIESFNLKRINTSD